MDQEHQPQTKHSDHEREGEGGESESFMATLARREGWWKPFFLFQGCWLPIPAVKSVIAMQAQFQPRPDDIIIATYPKCGTTWIKGLAFAIVNRSQHPITKNGGHPLLMSISHDLVPFLELPFRDLHPITELEALPSPRILGTHLPLTLLPSSIMASGCRIVYLCREPKDVLVSTWHFWNKVRGEFRIELEQAFELFCEGVSICGPMWDHCLGYWKQSRVDDEAAAGGSSKVLFFKYAEVMADPVEHAKMLAEFMRVPFTDEEMSGGVVEEVVRLCSFENLKALPVNSSGVSDHIGDNPKDNSAYFRSAKVGDWLNYLTQEMAQKLDCIIEEKLKGSSLSF